MQPTVQALCAFFRGGFTTEERAQERVGSDCLSLIKTIELKGGWIREDDEIFDVRNEALNEALERGLLTLGGGWSVGCRLTVRGRKALAAATSR
jgi:hypothetical protein